MAQLILKRGEQKTVSVDVSSPAGTTDLTQCSDIVAYFIQDGQVISKYKLVTATGYYPLSLDGVLAYRFNITLLKAHTKALKSNLTAQIKFRLKYADGTDEEGTTNTWMVRDSEMADE